MQRTEEAAKVIVENIQQIEAKRAEKWERLWKDLPNAKT
jgi:hypothetical protein